MLKITNAYRGRQSRENLMKILKLDKVFSSNTDEYIRFIFRISKYNFFKIDYMLNSDEVKISFVMKNETNDFIEMCCKFSSYNLFSTFIKVMNGALSRENDEITIDSMTKFFSLAQAEKLGDIIFSESEEVLFNINEKIAKSPEAYAKRKRNLEYRRKRLTSEIEAINKELSNIERATNKLKETFSISEEDYQYVLDKAEKSRLEIKASLRGRDIFVKQIRRML